jgi:hypothetical protein
MPDYDIIGFDSFEEMFQDQGVMTAMGENIFTGDALNETEVFQYLAENPWVQWGATEAEWNTEGFTPGVLDDGSYAQPYYFMYENVDEDSPYTDMEDLMQELYGNDVDDVYATLFDQTEMGFGTEDSIYDQYMDEFFDYDPTTGEFKSAYDAQLFEQDERERFALGTDRITTDLETSMGKFRSSGMGRGLGDIDLDISDIASMVEGDTAALASEYRMGVEQSESAYLDDLMDAIGQMAADSTIYSDIGD